MIVTMSAPITATLISIGDEILIGQIVNTNVAWMAQRLNEIGLRVCETITVADDAQQITATLDRALQQSEVVLITGGLGPTKDDITKKTLGAYFHSNWVEHEDILRDLTKYMQRTNRPMLDSVREMAIMPHNCRVLRNLKGLAAAMWFEQNGRVVVSLPGVPHEMQSFMSHDVLPQLQQQFNLPHITHYTLMTASLGESIIAEKIRDIEDSLPPYIKLAYLPTLGVVRLRLSAYGGGELSDEKTAQLVEQYANSIAERLTDKYVFAHTDTSLAQVVGNLLLDQKATLSVAESCTGGKLAHDITSIAGSSHYFRGGVVAYDNSVKRDILGVAQSILDNEGAVSEACVRAMAEGARQRLNTDYAIATTGIAGPDGGTPEQPVGTIWVAVSGNGQTHAQRFTFTSSRDLNIPLAANVAMAQLRRLILRNL